MFTTGQWIFVILFVVTFVIVMVYAYRKDLKLHKRHYRGSIWVLVALILFIAILFVIKVLVKK